MSYPFLKKAMPITHQQWDDNIPPLVSISCLTYNHGTYISDAIEGFLIQNTNFKVEILIHDDASTDNTPKIVSDYSSRFPSLIKPIFQSVNQYSKDSTKIGALQRERAHGKYYALCEGDDYWIDPYKLLKQVLFLESHPAYGLVHTSVRVYNQSKQQFLRGTFGDSSNTYFDFLLKNRVYTLTALMRKSHLLSYHEDLFNKPKTWLMGDYPMWIWFSYHSKIGFLPECTAVRRLRLASESNPINIEKKLAFFRSTLSIKQYFIDKYGCPETELGKIELYDANLKIRKAILLQLLSLYEEGISDKYRLGIKPTMIDTIYGKCLKYNVTRFLLKYLAKLRTKAL